MTAAMKSKDSSTLDTLRVLWAQIRNTEIDKKEELSDAEVVQAVQRQVKQLGDALNDFTAAARADLVDKTTKEIALLQSYLPAQLSDEELSSIVETVLSGLPDAVKGNFGAVMGKVMQQVSGKADGVRVKDFVERLLSGRA